ncbi:MAG: hypothetical protein LUQ04_02440 [Methanoregula sp.]|nr:hypothetical protein [Methanoregula sp.]
MKKTMVARIFWAGAGVCLISSGLFFTGLIPLSVCAAVHVLVFPVTVLALFFWWMAGQSGGDIPFIGY